MDTTRRFIVLAVLFGVSFFNLFPVVCNSSSIATSLPIVYVDPPSVSVECGEGFTIQVSISGVVDLMGFDIKLSYDTEILDAVDSTIDPFLNEPTLVLMNEIDEVSGIIRIAVISLGGAPAAGDGSLATITFQSTLSGEGTLGLYDTVLADSTSTQIPHETVDGSIVVLEIPTLYIDPAETSVLEGDAFTVQVNISGAVDVNGFDIKLSYDTTFLDAVDSSVGTFLNEPIIVPMNEIDEVSGIIWIAAASLSQEPTSGDGSLATITFQSTLPGEGTLDLYDTFLVNATGYPLSHITVDGSVVVEGMTTLYIDPAEITVLVGQVFTVDVKLENARDLYGFAIGIGYDASHFELVKWEFPPWNLISGRTGGIMWLAGRYPKSGSLTLLSITFKAKLEGSSPIHIYHHQLATIIYYPPARDPVGWPMNHTTEDGQCTILSPSVDILPNMLSLASRPRYVTAFIELPLGYDINEIDISTLLLNNTIPVDNSAPVTIGDHDDDGLLDLAVKFNGTEATSYILDNVDITERFTPITLTVNGRLHNGVTFQGSDTITVMKPIRGRREGQLFPL